MSSAMTPTVRRAVRQDPASPATGPELIAASHWTIARRLRLCREDHRATVGTRRPLAAADRVGDRPPHRPVAPALGLQPPRARRRRAHPCAVARARADRPPRAATQSAPTRMHAHAVRARRLAAQRTRSDRADRVGHGGRRAAAGQRSSRHTSSTGRAQFRRRPSLAITTSATRAAARRWPARDPGPRLAPGHPAGLAPAGRAASLGGQRPRSRRGTSPLARSRPAAARR